MHHSAKAATHIVDTDEVGNAPTIGALTLEMALNNAVDGDSILIDFSGSLDLTSTLLINKGVTIIGPSPIHFTIDFTGITSGSGIDINAPGGTVNLENVTFQNYAAAEHAVNVTDVAQLNVKLCQFTNNSSASGNGGAVNINVGVSAYFESTSFYQNSSAADGGAIYHSGFSLIFRNCSFLDNQAQWGGAVYMSGDGEFTHCTFFNNAATMSGGAVFIDSGANDVKFGSCLFDNTNGDNVYDAGTAANSLGNNLMDDDAGTGGSVFTTIGDVVSGSAVFGLRPAGPKKDGFGLWWIPITDPISSAINAGGTSSLSNDGRRAPRRLGVQTDIGAIEYTPYTVTSTGSSSSIPGTFAFAITQSALDGAVPAYIDFDIGTTPLINTAGTNFTINTYPTIIDGYTQPGTSVPGPGNATNPKSAPFITVALDGGGAIGHCLLFTSGGNNNTIMGLAFNNYENGIEVRSDGNQIYGNLFGGNEDGSDATNSVNTGIVLLLGNDNEIGGSRDWQRNLFAGCDAEGIYFDPNAGSANRVYSNFFGINGQGDGAPSNANNNLGIRLNGGSGADIQVNVFGYLNTGIRLDAGSSTLVKHNIVGMDPDAWFALPLAGDGIVCDGILGSRIEENYVGNCANTGSSGIFITGAFNTEILNNVVGLRGDEIGVAPNYDGIVVGFASDQVVVRENLVSANTHFGIVVSNSTATEVDLNDVGLDGNGSGINNVGNDKGILLDNAESTQLGTLSAPNTVADNLNNGIELVGTNCINNVLDGNRIGFETDNTTPAGNGNHGILLANNANSNTITNLNRIAHNTNDGVHLSTDANNNVFSSNGIHDNGGYGIFADGSLTNYNTYTQNDIFNNGSLGIENATGANQSLQAPEIIAATDCNTSGNTTIRIMLFGVSSGSNYTLEFFQIVGGDEDPSGFGEGDNYWSTQTVTASANGNEEFLVTAPTISPPDVISMTVTDSNGNTSAFSNWFAVANPLSASAIATDVTCNGGTDGSVDATITGGNGVYAYNWTDGVSTVGYGEDLLGVPVGNYTLTVSDTTGCSTSTTAVTVSAPTAISVVSTASDYNGYGVSCFGATDGYIDFTISGGTPPYDISVDGGTTFALSGVNSPATVSNLGAGTYDVLIRDAAGCIVTGSSISLIEPADLLVSTTITDASCNGAFDGTVTASASGGISPFGYNWSTLGSGQTHTGVGAGSYTVTVTDQNGCMTTDIATVNEPPAITIGGYTIVDVDCFGNSTGEITATGITNGVSPYSISTDNGTSFTGGVTATGLTAGNYDVVIQDGNGCTTTTSTQTVSEPAQLLSIGSSTQETCLGDNDGTLTLDITGGTGPFDYNWYSDAGYTTQVYTNNSNLTTDTYTGVTPGMYYPEVIDFNGCSHYTGSAVVNTGTDVVPNISGTDETCAGAMDGTAEVLPSGGTAPYDVQWYDDAALTNNIGSGNNITGLDSSWYFVAVTDQGGAGCSDIDSILVTSPPALNYGGATLTDPSCPGASNGSIQISVTGGVSPYQISTNGGVNYTTGLTETGLTDGTYDVVIQDDNGCTTGPHQESLSDPAADMVYAGVDDTICEGETFALNGTFTSNGATGIQWSTTGTGSFTPNNTTLGATYVPSAGDAGNSITITIETTGGGCPAVSDDMVLTVNQLDDATIAPVDFCVNSPQAVNILGDLGGTFSFLPPGPLLGTIDAADGRIFGTTAGTIDIVYQTSGACPNSDTAAVTAFDAPSLSTTPTDPTCFGDIDGSIFATAFGGTGPYNYSWNSGGTGQTLSNLGDGTYRVIVDDGNGCRDTADVVLTEPTKVTKTVNITDASCNGVQDGQFVLTAAGGAGPDYEFSYDGGTNYFTIPASGFTYTLINAPAQTYTVIVRDLNGCYSDTSVHLLNEPAPITFNVNASPDTCSVGVGMAEIVNVNGGNGGYSYSFNNGSSFGNNSTIQNQNAGSSSAVVEDANGCQSNPVAFTITNFTGNIGPFIDAGADQTICPGEQATLIASGGITYNWLNGAITGQTIPDPVVAPNSSTTYYVEIGIGSCSAIDSVQVLMDENCEGISFVTNTAFSPDNDGVNDTWVISKLADYPDNRVTIFNRWGDEVIKFKNYNNADIAWDGKNASGNALSAGTYFYVIDLISSGGNETYSGWVHIVK